MVPIHVSTPDISFENILKKIEFDAIIVSVQLSNQNSFSELIPSFPFDLFFKMI